MRSNGPPPLAVRIYGVWYRHMRVYSKNIFSNGLPPFLEPLIFLMGIGMGLGKYITQMDGMSYLAYLASGLLVTTAMYTSAFECSFGTFIRLEFENVYDGMLAAPLSVSDLVSGEILWAGTKGLFFTFAVACVLLPFGIISPLEALLAPSMGLVTGILFACISLWITSYIRDINHLNFYFTGFLSPMFFFSGVVFPIHDLPAAIRPLAEVFPLTHTVRLVRAICGGPAQPGLGWDALYCAAVITAAWIMSVRRFKKRLIT